MTEPGRHRLSAGWQTWLVLAGTMVAGRWIAGGGFGYTLFAVLWGPIAWVSVGRVKPQRPGRLLALFGWIGLLAAPWWMGWPAAVAARLTGWLTLFVGCLDSVQSVAGRFGRVTDGGVILLWIALCGVPVLMTDNLVRCLGEAWAAGCVSLCPVVIANGADLTAGDWTHQQIAYRWLTRLGQEFPFEGPVRWGIVVYGAIAAVQWIVPRGTEMPQGDGANSVSKTNPMQKAHG